MKTNFSTCRNILTLIGVLLAFLFPVGGRAVTPSGEEIDQARAWVMANFPMSSRAAALPPFSFVYGGKASREVLRRWRVSVGRETRNGATEHRSFAYTDPATGLEMLCQVRQYTDFPAVEWVLRFRNTGRAPTPILQQVHALDTMLGGESGRFVLHGALGSNAAATDFAPRDQILDTGTQLSVSPVGGRSSNTTALPFFNLQAPRAEDPGERWKRGQPDPDSLAGGGVVMGLGWSGQWSAGFSRKAESVRIQAGMELTHLSLQPNESIRTPRILLLFWKVSDWLRGQNLLRQFLLAHHTPRPGLHLPTLPVAACSWVAFDAGNKVTEKNQIEFASNYRRMMPIEAFWLDAGWFEGGWPNGVGNWFAKKDAFPSGLRPLSDAIHKMGMRFIVWFEPERVHQGTWLDTHHPEWLLGQGKNKLLNPGDDAARNWLTEHISQTITEANIDIYRNDFNIDPLPFWRAKDAADRQGITEIRYVEGLYGFWDELLKRHPGLLIDNCASGGRRLDLETISRSVALWRTDYDVLHAKAGPAGFQAQGVGLGLWIPLNATSPAGMPDVYMTRSAMGAGLAPLWDVRRADFNALLAKRLVNEEIQVRKYYEGDLYPLTAVSASDDSWFAYQYDRPDLGEGMLMAFRREKATEKSWTAKFRGLTPDRRYEVEDFDSGGKQTLTGKELAEGLRIEVANAPGSRLLVYKFVK